MYIHFYREREREGEGDRDRQTEPDRQTDRCRILRVLRCRVQEISGLPFTPTSLFIASLQWLSQIQVSDPKATVLQVRKLKQNSLVRPKVIIVNKEEETVFGEPSRQSEKGGRVRRFPSLATPESKSLET